MDPGRINGDIRRYVAHPVRLPPGASSVCGTAGAGGQEISSNLQRGPLVAASLASQVTTGATSSSATAT